jgi:ankyrin repeat protein
MGGQNLLNRRLDKAVKKGDAEAVRLALEGGANAKKKDSMALRVAARRGHAQCVRLLIPACDALADRSNALATAAENGHLECVKLLIPVSDPLGSHGHALRLAAQRGHLECVRALIPASAALLTGSMALLMAALNGHAQCVKLLMEAGDSLAGGSQALLGAAERGHGACVELLLGMGDPQEQALVHEKAADLARSHGFFDVAGQVESFMQSRALSAMCQGQARVPKRFL